jgi:Protein of unknown function (DUF2971)
VDLHELSSDSGPIKPTDTLYRYMSLSQLRYFLRDGITLTRVTKWPDRMETADFEFLQSVGHNSETRNKKDFFASCWTFDQILDFEMPSNFSPIRANNELRKDGFAAMWENYCKDGGVRISTTVEKLCNVFKESTIYSQEKIFYGPVHYCAQNDPMRLSDIKKIERTFFYKRIGFRHEAEFRFILNLKEDNSDYLSINISDYRDFLDEILIFPLKDNYLDKLANCLHQRGVDLISTPKTGTNMKSGQQFCRCSQLYGVVSETIGAVKFQSE